MSAAFFSMKRCFLIISLAFFLSSVWAALGFYQQMQTPLGAMHPMFTALKLMTPDNIDQRVIAAINSGNTESLNSYRQEVEQFYLLAAASDFSGSESQYTFSSAGHRLALSVYEPELAQNNVKNRAALPIIIYFHGGGFTSGNIGMINKLAQQLSHKTGSIVITPAYRLAPEHPYPAAFNDSVAALKWVHTQAQKKSQWDNDRIFVAGDSAGGNLAAAVALFSRDNEGPAIAGQILIYPDLYPLEYDFDPQLKALNFQPSAAFLIATAQAYAAQTPSTDDYLSPGKVEDFHDFPATMIITAQFDLFSQEIENYIQQLKQHNISVKHRHYPGLVHGFISMVGLLDEVDDAFSGIDDFIQQYKKP